MIFITPTEILVEMNFTEISVVSTEIHVLDHLYNQVETVTETVSEFTEFIKFETHSKLPLNFTEFFKFTEFTELLVISTDIFNLIVNFSGNH